MSQPSSDKQNVARLRQEVADILLGAESPGQTVPQLKPLIEEYQSLAKQQDELKSLEKTLSEVLPIVEQVETDVAEAEKQVLAEKKQLASFAGELGRTVFAGFQAGELQDHGIFVSRKELQKRIDSLQQQRATLLAEQKTTFIEKTKQQAQQLTLAGQIKIEELKTGSADRALGEAILNTKENLALQCSLTESVLKSISDQQKQIEAAQDRQKKTAELSDQRRSECAARLERTSVALSSLRAELKETKKRVSQNESRLIANRESTVAAAIGCDALIQSERLGESLQQLRAAVAEKTVAKQPLVVGDKPSSDAKGQVPRAIPWATIGSVATCVWVLFMLTVLVWRVGSFFVPEKKTVATSNKPNANSLEKQEPKSGSDQIQSKRDPVSMTHRSATNSPSEGDKNTKNTEKTRLVQSDKPSTPASKAKSTPPASNTGNPEPAVSREYSQAITVTDAVLFDDVAKRIISPIVEQAKLKSTYENLSDRIGQQKAKKNLIKQESTRTLGESPTYKDPASNLKRDEFETQDEFMTRIAQLREEAKEKARKDKIAWDERMSQTLGKESKQIEIIDQEISRLEKEQQRIDRDGMQSQKDRVAVEGVIGWFSLSPLTEYDIDRKVFPNMKMSQASIANPKGKVILYAEKIGESKMAILSSSTTFNPGKTYEIHVADRMVAKQFKSDWQNNKIFLLSDCRCQIMTYEPDQELVIQEEVSRKGPDEADPDYGTVGVVIGSVLLAELLGGPPEENRAVFGHTTQKMFSEALSRKRSTTIVEQKRIAARMNIVDIDVTFAIPKAYKIGQQESVEEYKGVSIREKR